MASSELAWEHVDSSNIERVSYAEDTQILAVKFRNGGLYTYTGVSLNAYLSLKGAESVGKYLNQVIKVMNPYQRHNSEDELRAFLAQ